MYGTFCQKNYPEITVAVSDFRLRLAVDALQQGALIVYPTEGVWGLGCDPYNLEAVQTLLQLKQRAVGKGLILVAADIDQFEPYLQGLNKQQLNTLQQSWPGPNTWLVPANDAVPPWISGGQATVALRVSAHPVIKALCTEFGATIVSTSANISGKAAARSLLDVQLQFSSPATRHVTLVPGSLGDQDKPTTIRELVTGKVIRN
jgi:L-threonylcarbamoyladenylate synthase